MNRIGTLFEVYFKHLFVVVIAINCESDVAEITIKPVHSLNIGTVIEWYPSLAGFIDTLSLRIADKISDLRGSHPFLNIKKHIVGVCWFGQFDLFLSLLFYRFWIVHCRCLTLDTTSHHDK